MHCCAALCCSALLTNHLVDVDAELPHDARGKGHDSPLSLRQWGGEGGKGGMGGGSGESGEGGRGAEGGEGGEGGPQRPACMPHHATHHRHRVDVDLPFFRRLGVAIGTVPAVALLAHVAPEAVGGVTHSRGVEDDAEASAGDRGRNRERRGETEEGLERGG